MSDQLLEALAAYAHHAWAGWMHYMLGNWTPENLARWKRQMATDYEHLPDDEKESDRRQAIVILSTILADKTIRALAQKLADSPCPGCYATQAFCEPGTRLRSGPPDDDIESCPHCGEFHPDRRGYFAIDAPDALSKLEE
jgi:hypothetical protein